VRKIEDYSINPFDPDEDPALFLLGRSIVIMRTHPEHRNADRRLFRASKGEFLGFLVILRKLAQRYDKDPAWGLTWAEGDAIRQRFGSGRGVETVTLKNRAKTTKSRKTPEKGFQPPKNN
jgi:hypothetical protein